MTDRTKSLAKKAVAAASKAVSKVGSSRRPSAFRPPTRGCPIRGASGGNVRIGSAGGTDAFLRGGDERDLDVDEDEEDAEAVEESTVNAQRQNTPQAPPPPPEEPSDVYQERDFGYEYEWKEQELRSCSQTAAGFVFIEKNKLQPLLVPATKGHERLSRLFFQNLSLHVNQQTGAPTLTIRIDGWEASFTKEDVARALGIPATAGESELPFCPPNSIPDLANCYLQLNELRSLQKKKDITRRTYMRQEMWLVDHFITKQIYPVGHRSERRPPVTQPLWFALNEYWLDAGALIFEGMWKVHQSQVKCKKQTPCEMAYTRYITALLRHLGFPFRPNEPYIPAYIPFGSHLWYQSLKSCRDVVNIPYTDDEADVVHLKLSKYYAALPHLTPPDFVPWVPPPIQRSAPPGQQQEDATQAQPGVVWDSSLFPNPRANTRKKRRAAGEGSSAAPEGTAADIGEGAQASGADMAQLLAGMRGLQLGFESFSGQFGEDSLSQRMGHMDGRIGNVETQVQELRAEYHQNNQLWEERYQQSEEQFRKFNSDFANYRDAQTN